MNNQDTQRFIAELRQELRQALELLRARMSVDSPAETFSPSHITGAMVMLALEQSLHAGISPQNFIDALRAAANQLDIELQTKTGFFAQINPLQG